MAGPPDDFYLDIIRNAPLKPNTIKSYLNNLNTILRHVNSGIEIKDNENNTEKGAERNTTLDMVLRQPDRFYSVIVNRATAVRNKRLNQRGGAWLKKGPSDAKATIRSQVKTLIALLKYSGIKKSEPKVYDEWYKYFDQLNKVIAEREDNNLPTAATDMMWEEILARRSLYAVGSMEHVTLGMYTFIPPRRQTDYYKLARSRAVFDAEGADECTGWLDLNARRMRVTQFKTKDIYKDYECDLPAGLVESIKVYLAARDARSKKKGQLRQRFLFTKLNGEPYPGISSFTDANNTVLKRALDNPDACVNTIRHAAASYVATSVTMLRGEKKQWATAMGHSLAMQGHYVIARIEDTGYSTVSILNDK